MRRLTLFIVSLVLWYLVSWPYDFQARTMDWQILAAGGVFSLVASLLFVEVFTKHPRKIFGITRWFWAILYVPVFFWYMIVANLDVAYRVLHPRLPIRPGIVKVKTSLKSESGRTALANSITLTPGTMSVDITDDGYLYIHWIYVQAEDVEGATLKIVAPFEKFLKRIFD
jgi:multicomponent Na+:H+ antiporter subunit E